MKTQPTGARAALILAMLLALPAGTAVAQGTFSPGQPKSTWNSGPAPKAPTSPYRPPASQSPAARPKVYEAPKSPDFKPYQPYKSDNGASLFGPDHKPRHPGSPQ